MSSLNTSILERIRQPWTRTIWHVNHFEAVLGTGLEVRIRASNRHQTLVAEAALLAEIDRLPSVVDQTVLIRVEGEGE